MSSADHPRPRRSILAVALAGALIVALAGCGRAYRLPAQRTASRVAHLSGGPPAHIAVVVMENEEYGGVIGNRATPYIDGLAQRSALAVQMYAIRHPSLPNYLALTAGSTFSITSDCTSCRVTATSLVDQLQAAGLSWRAYMEDLPRPCFTAGGIGRYAKKHDPFMYYARIASDPGRCANVVPLTRLATDERNGTLPRLIWITPNLCHDMHDCDPVVGDRYLARLLPGVLARLGARGLLFLTWDEGTSDDGCCRLATGGHIATIVAGPGARAGARLSTPADHYSVLQTIEDVLGLPRLRGAACACTPSLGPLLQRG